MKFLENFKTFKLNEAFIENVQKVRIDITFNGLVGATTFFYGDKPMNPTPLNITFLEQGENLYYATAKYPDPLTYVTIGTLKTPLLIYVKKVSIVNGKVSITKYAPAGSNYAVLLSNNPSLFSTPTELSPSVAGPIPSFDKDLGSVFAPNVATIDETKKNIR